MTAESSPQNASLSIVRDSLEATRKSVLGSAPGQDAGNGDPYGDAQAKAVQSVAQSAAIAVQGAVEMMRNVTTVEVTAIGVATAEWIAQPEVVLYGDIIDKSLKNLTTAAEAMGKIAQEAAAMVERFKPSSS